MARMATTSLEGLSRDLAALVQQAGGFVVQVAGANRPASGVIHGPDTIVTTARAIGREDGLRIRLPGAEARLDATLAGWDPATGIALLKTAERIPHTAPQLAESEPQTGELVVAVGRSWSNALTASSGNVAIVGGPLRTGRRRQIPRVFRITAPLHEGFAGGAVVDARGRLTGIATSSSIRGFGVVIPAAIAWAAAAQVQAGGTPRQAFLGVAVQPVTLPAAQQVETRTRALLIVSVTPSSPAELAGLMVGDLLMELDGRAMETPDHLLDLLSTSQAGAVARARVLRGGSVQDVQITLGERTRS
jgi:S1-C subfamily serine protease